MTDEAVALVTGSSTGLGLGISQFLVTRGFKVVGCSRRPVPSFSERYDHEVVDVSDPSAVRRLVYGIEERHSRLDLVVNNASVAVSALAAMTSAWEMENAFHTNTFGTMLICREAVRPMIRARRGRIINIASVSVPLQTIGAAAYSATKAAVIQYTKVLAKEISTFNVTCNVVAPSLVETDMSAALEPAAVTSYLEALTIRRFASIEDVTNAVWFFARPESGYLTGQVLYLGLTAS